MLFGRLLCCVDHRMLACWCRGECLKQALRLQSTSYVPLLSACKHGWQLPSLSSWAHL